MREWGLQGSHVFGSGIVDDYCSSRVWHNQPSMSAPRLNHLRAADAITWSSQIPGTETLIYETKAGDCLES